jgi:hypothetical protein
MHKEVQRDSNLGRDRARAQRNKAAHLQPANFDVGDFVLVAKQDFAAGEKLTLRWRGPRKVVRVLSDYVCAVEDLRDSSVSEVDNTRLRFYCDFALHSADELLEHVEHNDQGYPFAALRELTYDKESKRFMVRVSW